MAEPHVQHVTQLLLAVSDGDAAALNDLMPLVYRELRSLAGRALHGERRGQTLDGTSLVHEAYMRLVEQRHVQWRHRAQFFGLAAELMRRIIVDHARRRAALKRGAGRNRAGLTGVTADAGRGAIDVAAVDDALQHLADFDAQQARIVELRYFGGLTIEQTAEVLGISPATVKRDWTVAKAWLQRELSKSA